MALFGEHGQLRWDENQGAQYIVAWDVDGNQANLNGVIRYQLNNQNGYVAPKVALVNRVGGITLTNDAGNGIATLTIAPNSTPKIDDKKKVSSNGAYYVALTQGYLSGNRMPDGDYIIADAYVTALVPPNEKKHKVAESREFEEEFKIEIRLDKQAGYSNLEVCYYNVEDDKWQPAKTIGASVAASIENQMVTVKTKRLGQYVVTSIAPPPDTAVSQRDTASNALDTLIEAGVAVEAAGRAMQASAKFVQNGSGNNATIY